MLKKKTKALYFIHLHTSFTDIDIQIFSERFQVKPHVFSIKGQMNLLSLWTSQLVFLLKNIRSSEIGIAMFAGYHTIVPVLFFKLFRKPFLIVAGGIDCVSFPEVNYGNFSKKILGAITCMSFRNCTHIAPISDYLVDTPYVYTQTQYRRQGFRYFCRNLKTPHTVVYNGFNLEKWKDLSLARAKNSFLSIAGNLDNKSRVAIKGIDLILETAAKLPDCTFTIIGKDSISESTSYPGNVRILPFVPHDQLMYIYNQHEYYLQLSMSEGFGNTLAESMLCGCVPIGSNAGAIPMIIADTGFILPQKDPELLAQLIRGIINLDHTEIRKKARNRILENFDSTIRARSLNEIISKLIRSGK